MKPRLFFSLVAIVGLFPPFMAQAGAQVTRDATAPAAAATREETASLSGLIVANDEQATALRRAVVMVSGSELRVPRGAITDDDGRFAIARLPAGRFTVTVSKPAYVTSVYGASSPGRPGTPVSLSAGERREIRMTLSRGGVISGVLRDTGGRPVAGMTVSVSKASQVPVSALNNPDAVTTDDRGSYRIFGLAPGAYIVSATPGLMGSNMRKPTDDEVDATLRALQQRRSVAGGIAAPTTTGPSSAPPGPPVRTFGFAPVHFPGTSRLSEAGPIEVTANTERSGVDFTVAPVPVASVEGVVTGLPPGATATLVMSGADGRPTPANFAVAQVLAMRPGADGRFRYTNVTPGRYIIGVRSSPPATAPAGSGAVAGGGASAGGISQIGPQPTASSGRSLWAMATVDVSGADVTGVILSVQDAFTLRGRVRFDGDGPPPASVTDVRVTVGFSGYNGSMSVNGTTFGLIQRSSSSLVRPDTTFDVSGIVTGSYSLSATVGAASSTWHLVSATDPAGRDLLDAPLEFTSSDIGDVTLTFSDRHTTLSGTLTSAAGLAAPDYYVVVFPADRALWVATRRVQSTRPATDGRYTLRDLPPGDYRLAALTDVDPAELSTPAFLEQLQAASIPVTLQTEIVQDLRLR